MNFIYLMWKSAAFLAYGTLYFTKRGCTNLDKAQLNKDLNGKHFLVTGANSGIGYSSSLYFATKGGTVHMVCRNKEKGLEAQEKIKEISANEKVYLHVCDLGLMEDVRKFASLFIAENYPLDVLINNAGVILKDKETTSEGLDTTFATNLLSPFLLTNLLIPTLQKSSDPRIIMVSSGGCLTESLVNNDPGFTTLNPWDGIKAYAVTKRQLLAITEKFSEMYPNMKIYSMHPGWADTPGVTKSMPEFKKFYESSLRTPEEGVDTICWLAVSDTPTLKQSGEFFRDREIEIKHLPLSFTTYKDKDRDELWNLCSNLSKITALEEKIG